MQTPRIDALTPSIDRAHGFLIGTPHRQNWQFSLLVGLGAIATIALMGMMFLMAAMVTVV